MKLSKLILSLFIGIFVSSCSEDEILNPNTEIKSSSEIKADTETITKIIGELDQTFKYSQNEGKGLDEASLNKYFLERIEGLEVEKKALARKGEKEYSEEFRGFSSQISNVESFSSEDDYIDHLNNLNNVVLASHLSTDEKQILVDKIAFMNAFVNWMGLKATEMNKNKTPLLEGRSLHTVWSWLKWGLVKVAKVVLGLFG